MKVAVLSPHRDDAAFSCGLALQHLLMAGHSLTIVNVCTISSYAPYLTEHAADLTRQITDLRRNEDMAFVDTLRQLAGVENASVEQIDLAWQDVPLRWRMEDHLALAPKSLPSAEVRELCSLFHALPPCDLVFAPMALGGHLDHRLVLRAAEQTFPVASLAYYEDLPYACSISALEEESSGFQSDSAFCELLIPMQGAASGSKRRYALCYPSQIAVEVAEEMESHSLKHGGRERFLMGKDAMRMLISISQHGAVIA